MQDSQSYSPKSSHVDLPTQAQLNSMLNAHRRFCRSYEQAQRKIRIYRLLKKAAWLLFFGDIYFTYQGVALTSGSTEFALFAAAAVGGLQWSVSESLLTRSLRDLVTIDRNKDGKISIDEMGRWGITIGSIALAYGLDIVTNLLAIDAGAMGSLGFELLNLPANGFLVNLIALFICLALVFSDEMIHNLADNRLSQLNEEMPALRERAAIIEAKIQAASGFSYELLQRAETEGSQRGRNYKI
jgi:hypothetical protein